MYTSILFAVQTGGGDSFTLSREVPDDDLSAIYDYIKAEAQVEDEDIDTILLVRNGNTDSRLVDQAAPEVFKHWTAANGDFEGLGDHEGDDSGTLDDAPEDNHDEDAEIKEGDEFRMKTYNVVYIKEGEMWVGEVKDQTRGLHTQGKTLLEARFRLLEVIALVDGDGINILLQETVQVLPTQEGGGV